MKTELFLSILSSLLSPLPGETGAYHKHTWKDQWVNVSVDTPIPNYQTQNRLYVGTNGMVNNTEKTILRVDRTRTIMNSYDKSIIEFNINVECVKKESTITHIVYRNSINEITSMVKIDKTQSEKFAELIVKECANWMCDERDEERDGIGDSFYWADRMLKHFGVDNK
jgi:hypothetical protein